MFVDLNNVRLQDNTYAYIGRAEKEEILKTFQDELKRILNTLDILINRDFKSMSDEDFYNLILKVYNITLGKEDYLKIISKMNNKNFNRFMEIGTYMTFNDLASEGRGKSFDWWKQLYQVKYIIAVSENTDIEYDATLTKEEIKNLIKNKDIVIVKTNSVPILNSLHPNESFETMPSIDLGLTYSYGSVSGYVCKNDNFPITVSLLRKKFTKKKIIKDMKSYIDELQTQIDEILSSNFNDYLYSEVSKLCNNWYNKSEEKQKILSLTKQINK